MSGICGICEPGAPAPRLPVSAMIPGLLLSGDEEVRTASHISCAFGLASNWSGQQLGQIPGVEVALDGDLLKVEKWNSILGSQEPSFRELSIAERIAHLYRIKGDTFLSNLEGAFSLALWDEGQRRLILAVDRMGIKSLTWARKGDRILFATRATAIRLVQKDPAGADPPALMQYLLFSVVPAPLTGYQGIKRIPPGTAVSFQNGSVIERRYWDVEYTEDRALNKSTAVSAIRETLRSAVGNNLEGCPAIGTGAFLSGGTDSSSVVAFMTERLQPTQTFSVFFDEEPYSEIGYARIAASRYKTVHREKRLTSADAALALTDLLRVYDEPFANSSAFGSLACARLAKESGVSTLLAGDGGDEIFAGNERYASDRYFSLYRSLPYLVRRGLVEPIVGLLPSTNSKWGLPSRFLRRASIPNPHRIFSYGLYFSIPPEEVFQPAFLNLAPFVHWMDIAAHHFGAPQNTTELNRLMYLDLKLILADNDLRKVSATAEMSGVRVRYPMLDVELVKLAARIPSSLKLRGFEKRYVFKKAMAGILPEEILKKKKHGFGVPLGHWLLMDPRLESLVQDILHDSQTRNRGYFRPEFLDQLSSLHRGQHTSYYGEAIWYIVALELWHRQHLEALRGSLCEQ